MIAGLLRLPVLYGERKEPGILTRQCSTLVLLNQDIFLIKFILKTMCFTVQYIYYIYLRKFSNKIF